MPIVIMIISPAASTLGLAGHSGGGGDVRYRCARVDDDLVP
jgi:hypothetical protein